MFSWFQQNTPTVVNQKQRLLGSAENALMQASQQCQGYMKFGEVLHIRGPHISLNTLSMAINHLQRRHPVLRSRLQINPEKSDTYILEEDDTVQLKIRQIPRKRVDHQIFWRQEWRARERDITAIGQGLAEFWLLQDPEDDNDNNSPREIVVICEHSVCDGLSLSNVTHELLIALAGENDSIFQKSLNWPITMETAIQQSLSFISRVTMLGRFILAAIYSRTTNKLPIARIPLADIINYSHTEASYGVLNKEETQKLVEKCRRQGVTVTSAVGAAMLCAVSTVVKSKEENRSTALHLALGADTRRRCIPPIPNHDLTYHVSGMMSFVMPTEDIPITAEGIWELAKIFGCHTKSCIDAGQILALGMIMGKIFQKTLGPPNFDEHPTCGVSSWGILPFREQYGRWQLEAMTPFVNMNRTVMPFTTIQTVNGILTFMFVGTDPIIPISILETLRDGTMQKLHQMIDD
ncbi:unnamed protein product [Adineta steineri]|uniref:Phthiocerol/phthiodiolone dimycocerosyl transferase C-terminal domain-containing protein n=1 Tax=Adineta steineri TaxID=433720 RepID=A0A814VKX5_9BILA|nr:unnamed protein product [Adineta steineri]CAF4034326.1 unnamed protein product [Adineta steineri]